MKKIFNTLICLIFITSLPLVGLAADSNVQLLQPSVVSGISGTSIDAPGYISGIFTTILSLAAIFAVLQIVVGGIQYMMSNVPSVKDWEKSKIYSALVGLIILLAIWLILNTINPKLLNINVFNAPSQTTGK